MKKKGRGPCFFYFSICIIEVSPVQSFFIRFFYKIYLAKDIAKPICRPEDNGENDKRKQYRLDNYAPAQAYK